MTFGFSTASAFAVIALGLSLWTSAGLADQAPAPKAEACARVGTWLDPASGETLAPHRLLGSLSRKSVVLLGETHDNAEHHRWQLHSLAALHAIHPRMTIGFEMFPRRIQPVLDRWVAGELGVEAFLEAAEWREVWAFDPALYLPLFHFARQKRLSMVALNVDRDLVSRVGREGWAAVPADERAGVGDPAPALEAYREVLARIFAVSHLRENEAEEAEGSESGAAGEDHAPAEEIDIPEILEREDFAYFVEAQLTWDRAMAEALAAARGRDPDALVVGVLGSGHIEGGYGVPYQLADLGLSDAAVLLAVESGAPCEALTAAVANAVFLIAPVTEGGAAPAKPRLGVMIEPAEGGVRVARVMEGSVAEAAALQPDDLVVAAAGVDIEETAELVEIVQRQAPGTWLPLTIMRGGRKVEVVAKFPSEFETGE